MNRNPNFPNIAQCETIAYANYLEIVLSYVLGAIDKRLMDNFNQRLPIIKKPNIS